jgi:hypothetical protein
MMQIFVVQLGLQLPLVLEQQEQSKFLAMRFQPIYLRLGNFA